MRSLLLGAKPLVLQRRKRRCHLPQFAAAASIDSAAPCSSSDKVTATAALGSLAVPPVEMRVGSALTLLLVASEGMSRDERLAPMLCCHLSRRACRSIPSVRLAAGEPDARRQAADYGEQQEGAAPKQLER